MSESTEVPTSVLTQTDIQGTDDNSDVVHDPKPLSKNAQKKMIKMAKRQASKTASNSAPNSETERQNNNGVNEIGKADETGETGESFEKLRESDLKLLEDAGFPVRYCYKYETEYPSKDPTKNYSELNFNKYHEDYDQVENESELESHCYYAIGRVNRIRRAGNKLVFIDIRIGGDVLQMKVNLMTYLDGVDSDARKKNFELFRSVIRVGDIWGFAGHVGKTKHGELSLYVHQMRLLTPCMIQLPPATKEIEVDGVKTEKSGLTNPEVRFRMRELDMIVNPNVYQTFNKRSRIIRAVQTFLEDQLGLIRVDTPILTPGAGGATAKPFVTNSLDYDCELFMRIAPELYLKRLIVAGFKGVYEIGKQFRNESNDLTHNSEFTSLEYYLQNVDFQDLMLQCEQLLTYVVKEVCGSLVITYNGKQIDFTPPFKRLDMLDALKEYAQIDMPADLGTSEAREFLDSECERLGVECSAPRTTARLLDKLVGEFVESKCINPTFITGHPIIMSPLSKPDRHGSQRTERFELFINCTELANAYTELNDPRIQEANFKSQARSKADGDDEAMMFDAEFIDSLKIGLPPTGGFGMGIDRLTMFLTNNTSIREVILFPTMKPGQYNKSLDESESITPDQDNASKSLMYSN